jgi:hypothetical protein
MRGVGASRRTRTSDPKIVKWPVSPRPRKDKHVSCNLLSYFTCLNRVMIARRSNRPAKCSPAWAHKPTAGPPRWPVSVDSWELHASVGLMGPESSESR